MYFYLGRNGRFYRSSFKTTGVENAQICITACFDENYDLNIYNVKRIAGTDVSKLYKVVNKVVDYAWSTKHLGTKCVILQTNKIPVCYLRKIGFETINGCTLLKFIS